jgi:hypothetical protein
MFPPWAPFFFAARPERLRLRRGGATAPRTVGAHEDV